MKLQKHWQTLLISDRESQLLCDYPIQSVYGLIASTTGTSCLDKVIQVATADPLFRRVNFNLTDDPYIFDMFTSIISRDWWLQKDLLKGNK